MIPGILLLAGSLIGTYLVFRPKIRNGVVELALPPAAADGSPPSTLRVPGGLDVRTDLSRVALAPVQPKGTTAIPHGALVPVTWEFMPGTELAGEGGGTVFPLLWVSADKKFAAIQWNLDPALGVTFAKPGDVLMARVAPRGEVPIG